MQYGPERYHFSTEHHNTGCHTELKYGGAMKQIGTLLLCTLTVFGQIELTVSTDSSVYSLTDTIYIDLIATNIGNQATSLPFENGCEAALSIGKWFSLDDENIVCEVNYHNLDLEVGESVEWTWSYPIINHLDNVGMLGLAGIVLTNYEPIVTSLEFIQIGEYDSTRVYSGFVPAVDTLRIEGGCVIPEYILSPDSTVEGFQKLDFMDSYYAPSINLTFMTGWDYYISSSYFWVANDSIPFSFSAILHNDWHTRVFPVGSSEWIESGELTIYMYNNGTVVDSVTQIIYAHITGSVTSPESAHDVGIMAFPNPFNSRIKFSFKVLSAGNVEIDLYSLLGEMVYSSNVGELNPAQYNFEWDGKDHAGKSAQAGVYIVRIKTNQSVRTKKVLLLK